MITFTSVFVILFFIFVLQGIWLFISDLAGKDLDTFTIIKFLSFYAPTIVPLVLPLSVLLAGIMTFGSFAENYEFAAMKSSGISLQRTMKMLSISIFILSIITFIFANNVIPESQYRFLNLRKEIVQLKPAMAITKGQFNTIGNINIKVEDKSGKNDEQLSNVTMHIKNAKNGSGANTIIKAKRGLLKSNAQPNTLQLELFDGNYYENIYNKSPNERKKQPFAKSSFSKYIVNIDLSRLNKIDDSEDNNITTEKMLNINELNYTIDSLETLYDKDVVSLSDNALVRYNSIFNLDEKKAARPTLNKDNSNKILSLFSNADQKRIVKLARSNVASAKTAIELSSNNLQVKKKNLNSHWIVYHEKFMIAFSCLLMFFIGAPLGAIIRKGGLGLPMVFAIIIFIAYHFLNVFGRKLAEEDAITPALGVWLSSIVLTPLAVFLTYRATNDLPVAINFDGITNFFKRIFSKKDETSLSKPIVPLHALKIDKNDAEYAEILAKDTSVLENIVKNSDQFGYTEAYRLKTLKVLEQRGITQNELKLNNKLYNKDYLQLQFNAEEFKFQSKINLVLYALVFVLLAIALSSKNILIIFITLLFLLIFYALIYKASSLLKEIGKITQYNGFINPMFELLIGFPFYILTYFYNNSKLKEVLATFNK